LNLSRAFSYVRSYEASFQDANVWNNNEVLFGYRNSGVSKNEDVDISFCFVDVDFGRIWMF